MRVAFFVCLFAFGMLVTHSNAQLSSLNQLSGDELYGRGKDLTAVGRHEEAATMFWGALMKANDAETYKVK
jgi:hypothetical protein